MRGLLQSVQFKTVSSLIFMKRILCLLLLTFSVTAFAGKRCPSIEDYDHIGMRPNGDCAYVESGGIFYPEKGVGTFSVLMNLAKADHSGWKAVRSFTTLITVDCSNYDLYFGQSMFYSKKNAQGKLVSFDLDGDPEPAKATKGLKNPLYRASLRACGINPDKQK